MNPGQLTLAALQLVAGRDPYAWKGTQDLMVPHVRPSGEGGCGDVRSNTA